MSYPPQYPPPGEPVQQPQQWSYPQQQGWQQPGQQPYLPQGYGYPPPPGLRPPTRQNTHRFRNFVVFPGIALIVLIVVIAVAANAGGSKKKNQAAVQLPGSIATSARATAPASTATTASSPTVAASKAHVGSTISLKGEESGEQLQVTLVQVAATTKATDGFSTPPTGDRYYAAQFRLLNTGTVTFSDAPGNDSIVLDQPGQQYQTDIVGSISAGQQFADQVNVPPGGTVLGWITYDVPVATLITTAQFTLDSGFADDTGQWLIP